MNLFELQERLKDFSQEQLVREMQAPSGQAPQYLVLSELMRRKRMQAEAQSEPAPQTTVAEDAIAAAGVPQGGIAEMARAMAPQTDMVGNTGVSAIAPPVDRMQDGGSVDNADGGFVRRLLNRMDERARRRLTEEEIRHLIDVRYGPNRFLDAINPAQSAADALISYQEGDYTGAVINAASALPVGKIFSPAMNVIADLYSRLGDEIEPVDEFPAGMSAGGEVRRMQVGGEVEGPYTNALRQYLATYRGDRGMSRPFEMDPRDPRSGLSAVDPIPTPREPRVSFEDAALGLGVDQEFATPPSGEGYYPTLGDLRDFAIGGIPERLYDIGTGLGFGPALGEAGIIDPRVRRAAESFEAEVEAPESADREAMMDVASSFEEEAMAGDAEAAAADERRRIAATFEAEAEADDLTRLPDPEPEAPTGTGAGSGGAGSAAPSASTSGFGSDSLYDQDRWLALAQFGLGLMSSREPTLGGAIGEAGLQGIAALRQARADRLDREQRELARADALAARSASAAARERAERRADARLALELQGGGEYPSRQVDDFIALSELYDGEIASIIEDNYGVPPGPDDPNFSAYRDAVTQRNAARRMALTLMGQ